MPTYLTPGLYYETVDATSGAIAAVRTDIAAFVGIAERGPIGTAVPVTSWRQFASAFGTFTENGYLAYSVKAFFENGGQKCYAARVAAPEVTTNSVGAQPADRLSSVVATVQGFASGASATVEQDAFHRTRRIAGVDTESSKEQRELAFGPLQLSAIRVTVQQRRLRG